MKKIFVILFLNCIYMSNVDLYLDRIDYIDSDTVDLYIKMDSDTPIASFNFTLNGFGNILKSESISETCLAFQKFESISFVDGYFSGGDLDGDIIGNGDNLPLLTIRASYNSQYLDGQYLTVKDISPGFDNIETHFYTINENGELSEITYNWIPMIWILGIDVDDNIIPWSGQDCNGNIWGTASEDDCGVCSGGDTNHAENSDKDCSGICFGDAQLLSYFRDFDGDGLIGDDLVLCGESDICSSQDDVPQYYNDDFEQYFDCILNTAGYDSEPDCPNLCSGGNQQIQTGQDSCLDDCGVCLGENSNKDCSGVCFGLNENNDWYADCDIDGLADNNNSISICGYPVDNDVNTVCGFIPDCSNDSSLLCGLISIDPNNHSFDASPNCTSNSIDLCGVCDGFNQYRDCQGQCAIWTPICTDPSYDNYQGSLACDGYIGLDSNSLFAYNHGIDDCGVCSGNNESCTGCTDSNATNYCEDCTIYDGSCTFILYPGDVDRNGVVDENDIDGLGIFWHQYGNPRDNQSIDWYMHYATDDWEDICAAYADTNGDGYINHLDLSAILYNWGRVVPDNQFTQSSSICYNVEEVGDYRQNFLDIFNQLDSFNQNDAAKREVINYLSSLLEVDFQPGEFHLYQNFPNPFNPITTINFDINVSSEVYLYIYNIKGQLIDEYEFGSLSPGLYQYDFNASNFNSGMYVYTIKTSSGIIENKKMILVK
ncbi:MAG: hypothetical protein CMG00_03290 [Candidatus Marinimicrobia bacterium]|nr:hypothetical protein [Candidatus Neomarinimicrobiota bacterium]